MIRRAATFTLLLTCTVQLNADDRPLNGAAPGVDGGPVIGSQGPLQPIPQTLPPTSAGPYRAGSSYSAGTPAATPGWNEQHLAPPALQPLPAYSPPANVYSTPFGGSHHAVPGGNVYYSAGSVGLPVSPAPSIGIGFLGYSAMGYGPIVGGPYPYTGAVGGGMHSRFPYYSYRRPWYTPGPAGLNVNIDW